MASNDVHEDICKSHIKFVVKSVKALKSHQICGKISKSIKKGANLSFSAKSSPGKDEIP